LVDDVYTSGATSHACVKMLKKAGAERVEIMCWARVLRDGEEGASDRAELGTGNATPL
jgi:adenine/guanine phosphoribosyltransferase-like PRPP-binding protein